MVMLVITYFMKKKNRRRNTYLKYDPKEEKFLPCCQLYVNHLEEYTKTLWPRGLSTEYVTEDKVWVFLFYQAHRAKRKKVED